MSAPGIHRERLGDLGPAVARTLEDLAARDAVARLWAGDHTLWAPEPTEIADRLGWLHVPTEMVGALEELDAFVAGCVADGFTDVLVAGMGGSSLFPEVLARSFPPVEGRLQLHVLDSTDPAAVGRMAAQLDPSTTLYLTSSKSGSTLETRSHLEFFWDHVGVGSHFAVVTDPGSELAALARSRGFRHVFENRSDIGGRYSALSYFGLVPAALAGVDWLAMLGSATEAAQRLRSPDPAVNAGLALGAVLAAGVQAGRDKVTLVIDERIGAFGLWLEQLLAESTGKAGTGVVPVADEALGPVDLYGADRLFVGIGSVAHPVGLDVVADAGHPVVELDYDRPEDLGAQVLTWEVATAVCGAVLGINAFDQPNVAEAKAATNSVLADGAGELPGSSVDEVLATLRPGDYVALQAYVDPEGAEAAELAEARLELRDAHRVATTFGLGPRFLHSTGQLHKGGPPTGVFVQVVGDDPVDAAIPGQDFTFGELKHAQADGDLLTLAAHGLRVARATPDQIRTHLEGAS